MLNDYGYIEKAIANIREVAEKQEANIKAAAALMADAIAAWTYRGGYGTVVGAPDALKLWDRIGANYRRVLGA